MAGAFRMVRMDLPITKYLDRACGNLIPPPEAHDRDSLSRKPLSFRISVCIVT